MPSLNALRAFEAVCRHLNFAHSAAELRVTPAAVKQLVGKLEEAVGHSLVKRSGRGLALTSFGLSAREDLTAGFSHLAKAVERMRKQSDRQRLIVSAEPSFATAWLVPRLDRFRAVNSEIDVLINSSLEITNLERGDADIALRFSKRHDAPLVAHRLFDERLGVFCSPALATGRPRLSQLQDLENATLLHWDMSALSPTSMTRKWMSWESWLERAGVTAGNRRNGIFFSDYNLLVQSAVAGQGVILGSLPVLNDIISAGLLVNPFGFSVDTDMGYDLVLMPETLERPEVRCFADWIIAEARSCTLPQMDVI